MSDINKFEHFKDLRRIVNDNSDPEIAWSILIRHSKEYIDSPILDKIESLDINLSVVNASKQLSKILKQHPIPNTITFLYFGLFDMVFSGDEKVYCGYYISGGDFYDPNDPDSLCDQTYFPEGRFISSQFLDSIKILGSEDIKIFDFVDYFVLLGAAAILTKAVLNILNIKIQAFVGFDDGDYLEI
jgi:hypothetical protein